MSREQVARIVIEEHRRQLDADGVVRYPEDLGSMAADRIIAEIIAPLTAERDRLAVYQSLALENTAIERARADAAEALLAEIAGAEKTYRRSYELCGDGHIQTGRAWDKLRDAGDRARSLLSRLASEEPT